MAKTKLDPMGKIEILQDSAVMQEERITVETLEHVGCLRLDTEGRYWICAGVNEETNCSSYQLLLEQYTNPAPKHWKVRQEDDELERITLTDPRGNSGGGVVSIKMDGNGTVSFREECDAYYHTRLNKQEAIAALQEDIQWIKEQ
jgi:hypothetical protein